MVKEIGFIGLGTVGFHIAANLLKAHYKLTVYDATSTLVDELVVMGAKGAASPYEAAQNKDMLIVVLPEKEEMEAAVAGSHGFMEGLRPGTILVDMGTRNNFV